MCQAHCMMRFVRTMSFELQNNSEKLINYMHVHVSIYAKEAQIYTILYYIFMRKIQRGRQVYLRLLSY